MARRRSLTALFLALIATATVLVAAPASAHHTTCYWETRNPSPYGSYDKFAYSGQRMQRFYIINENGGYRQAPVWFGPEIHGHGHSCLEGRSALSVQMPNNNDWMHATISYRTTSGSWVSAGSHWYKYGYLASSPWKLSMTSPAQFTHGRVQMSYYTNGAWSFPRTITCTLGRHGADSYACS